MWQSGKRDGVAKGDRAWGWQLHHTLITLCIFSLSIFLPVRVCLCMWALGHAPLPLFGAQLRLYPLTQNTDNTSNLFPLTGSLPGLWQSLWYPEKRRQPANANPDNITGAKNRFFQMTQTAHGQRRSMFTFQRTHKPPRNVLQIQMIGSPWGTLNLQSGRLTCKFGISNIQFVHMLSKSAFLFYFSFYV